MLCWALQRGYLASTIFLTSLSHKLFGFSWEGRFQSCWHQGSVSRGWCMFLSLNGSSLYLGAFIFSQAPWLAASCTYLKASPSCHRWQTVELEGNPPSSLLNSKLESHHVPSVDPHLSCIYPWLCTLMLWIKYQPSSQDFAIDGPNLFLKKLWMEVKRELTFG